MHGWIGKLLGTWNWNTWHALSKCSLLTTTLWMCKQVGGLGQVGRQASIWGVVGRLQAYRLRGQKSKRWVVVKRLGNDIVSRQVKGRGACYQLVGRAKKPYNMQLGRLGQNWGKKHKQIRNKRKEKRPTSNQGRESSIGALMGIGSLWPGQLISLSTCDLRR